MRRFDHDAISNYFSSKTYKQIKEGRGGCSPLRSLKIIIRRIFCFFSLAESPPLDA